MTDEEIIDISLEFEHYADAEEKLKEMLRSAPKKIRFDYGKYPAIFGSNK